MDTLYGAYCSCLNIARDITALAAAAPGCILMFRILIDLTYPSFYNHMHYYIANPCGSSMYLFKVAHR